MARAAPFTPLAPLEKLPLAVRKDLRDNYESEKAALEAKISEMLGTPFKININPNEVWAYNPADNNTSAGGLIKRYVEGFISALEYFLDKHGEEGKTHFNEAVTKSELTVNANELGDKAETISADVKDGVFRILFHHKKLGDNQRYLRDYLLKAVEEVPRAGLSIVAKTSIENSYNSEIDDVTSAIADILNIPDLVLEPNFEENFAALREGEVDDKGWESTFGNATLQYFSSGLLNQLEKQGFKGDDMLQEGIAEILTSKKIKLRVAKATKNNSYHEVFFEDGVLIIQTMPKHWWFNVRDVGNGLVNLL
ncbi:hypothetical protein Hypma_002190 [Hypsizygus marmoreus]|uniref:Uncharacterized protein n=1 Tax=Hypsizygus marmoreus TaxID=39966 RepID=A0A369K270_HYPMA|nr:hypothetical protein Hypma_002190 [Hypsizygus marmoreus]